MWTPTPPPASTPLWSPPPTSLSAPSTPLFPPQLISPAVVKVLPDGYTIRPLQKSDYRAGMLDVLRVLTSVGDVGEEEWVGRWEWMRGVNEMGFARGGEGIKEGHKEGKEGEGVGMYYVLVVECEGRVVGTGAVVVERKFIHNLGLVGHIEDISVAKNQQGKRLGLRIIEALDYIAKEVGCYKSILDCSEANEGFYVKCGYKRAGLEMSHYYEGSK
ncbi:Glucosamine-phosphate N-acetyltransferase-like protein [Trapelia coarctata]|nr:Glucosamine-phosphate N-acetyltransferase-like protein [Trapelia coarctata]